MIPFGPDQVRTAAFRHLLEVATPLPAESLAQTVGAQLDHVLEVIAETETAGLLRRDERGHIVGAAGLSVVPSRHELWIGDRRFWTWCAYDALGILAALQADGRVLSISPQTDVKLTIDFTNGQPADSGAVLFMAAMGECCSVYDEWCPTVNLFEDERTAGKWASDNGIEGWPLSLIEAAALGAQNWGPLVGHTPRAVDR